MGKPTVRTRPNRGQAQADRAVAALAEYVNGLAARLDVIERALSSVIESVEEIEGTIFDDDELVELNDAAIEPDDDEDSYEDELAAEAEQREEPAPPSGRTSTASLRRAERAAFGMDEDGPRPGIITDDSPHPAIPDFKAPDGGKQLQAPEYPRGEPGWSGDE